MQWPGTTENGISGYRIVGSTERGDDSVEVSAEVTQDGVATTHSIWLSGDAVLTEDGQVEIEFSTW